jgi:hypothetical protein
MKQAFIDATLPELKGGKIYKTARGQGCVASVAIARAVKALLKQCGRHRISQLKLAIVISEAPKEQAA